LDDVAPVKILEEEFWDKPSLRIYRPNPREDTKKAVLVPLRGAYTYYETLWKISNQHNEKTILCSFQPRKKPPLPRLVGYIAVERINESDIGRNMPPWNHNPEKFYKPNGNSWYIINHVSLESGVSEQLFKKLFIEAKKARIKKIAVIFNLRHPYITSAQRFWGHYGFRPLYDTYDPEWHYRAEKEEGDYISGAIIWAREI